MAKDNIIQFPLKRKPASVEARIQAYQARIDEIEVENSYMRDDIAYLKSALEKNKQELINIMKEVAIINGEIGAHEPVVEFENEWGDDFEFTPDFDIPDKPDTTLDELGDKLVNMAKELEDAVVQLTLDLNINKDEPEDK